MKDEREKDVKPVEEEVVFITGAKPAPGEAVLHKDSVGTVMRRIEEVKSDWDRIMKQIGGLVAGSHLGAGDSGFALQQVSVGLAFSASGKLGFIAEAGAEASITVTFERSQ